LFYTGKEKKMNWGGVSLKTGWDTQAPTEQKARKILFYCGKNVKKPLKKEVV